ncbi:MAG: relaxase/mobilization nuclease domain-containing protein [Lachnospiraceae bacterium]|nr:relaxase/mobilization nuclease domain-containing protein [Lachnospiraceae bacterium]
MAVNKVVNKSTKSHGAMRNVIEYILQDKKVKEGYVDIIGPYAPDQITWDGVYNSFLAEKKIWNKDYGRMYAHNIISFHKDEVITPEEALNIGREFADEFFSGYQSVIGVHQDKEHLHVHIVTNSVSYIDGLKLHQTKKDLEKQKDFTNNLCRERGLSVTEKGKHFDGSAMEGGEIIAWSKSKYNLFKNDSKKSFVADCAIALLESKENCCSKEEFIRLMEESGWHTIWANNKKHITFQNDNGDKVRDSNLSKSFSLNISKEALTDEFEGQNALQLAMHNNDRTEPSRDAEALIREVRTDINDNRAQNRAVVNTENKSVAREKQSVSIAEQRRLEKQRRALEQERARALRRKKSRSYDMEL